MFSVIRACILISLALTLSTAYAKERVISLAPHITEMIYAINAGDQLVGVMQFSDYPAAAKTLPVVGDAYALNYEKIVSLKPTLVLAWKGGTSQKQIDKLQSLKLNVLVVNTDTINRIPLEMNIIIRKLVFPGNSISIITQFEDDMKALEKRYSNAKPVKVFYEVWSQPLMTFGHDHPVSEAIRLCGGVNVFDDVKMPVPTVSRETLLARKPQLLLTAASKSEANTKPAAASLMPKTPLRTLDGDLITRMGPRFVQGAKQLCEAIDSVRGK